MKRNYMVPAAIVAAALIIGIPTVASAAATIGSAQIRNQSILSVDLAPNSVGSSELRADSIDSREVKPSSLLGSDIKDGSLGLADLSATAKDTLQGSDGSDGINGVDGSDGVNGVDGADGVVEPVYATFTANVANIGGSFSTQATKAGEVTLPAGKYLITTDALFRSNATTSGNTTLQVATRGVDGTQWGSDLGTGFTGASPVQADREVTTSTTRVVTLAVDTVVEVKVFGYDNAGQGSADSGLFDAEVYLTAVPVQ